MREHSDYIFILDNYRDNISREAEKDLLVWDIWYQWSRMNHLFFPSADNINLPWVLKTPTIFRRQLQSCFHNFCCRLRQKVLENQNVTVRNVEYYEELLDLKIWTEVSESSLQVHSDLSSDLTCVSDYRNWKEEVKTTIGVWTEEKKEELHRKDTTMLFFDSKTDMSAFFGSAIIKIGNLVGPASVLFLKGQKLLRIIRRVIPDHNIAYRSFTLVEKLERDINRNLIKPWYDHLRKKYNGPSVDEVKRIGAWARNSFYKTEQDIKQTGLPTPDVPVNFSENKPGVWGPVIEKTKPSVGKEKQVGGAFFFKWDFEQEVSPFVETGAPTDFFHRIQDLKKEDFVGIRISREMQKDPFLRELEYSGLRKETNKKPSSPIEDDINWWDEGEVSRLESSISYWASECKVPMAEGFFQKIFSTPDLETMPDAKGPNSIREFLSKISGTKMGDLVWQNSIIARILCSHKYIPGVNMRVVRLGVGSYLYSTGTISSNSLSVAVGTFVSSLPPQRAYEIGRNCRIYKCEQGYFIWQSWRHVHEADLEVMLNFTKAIVTLTTMTCENTDPLEGILNMNHAVEDWVSISFLLYVTNDAAARNCKVWNNLISCVDNDYVDINAIIKKIPSKLTCKIESLFWSKVHKWFFKIRNLTKIQEKNVIPSKNPFISGDENMLPPVFIRVAREYAVTGRIMEGRLFNIMSRNLRGETISRIIIAGKYGRKSMNDERLDKKYGWVKNMLKAPAMKKSFYLEMRQEASDICEHAKSNPQESKWIPRPCHFLYIGSKYVDKFKNKIESSMKNFGREANFDKTVFTGIRNSTGITTGGIPSSRHQGALIMELLIEYPECFTYTGMINKMARDKRDHISNKLNPKQGERGKKLREFQSEDIYGYVNTSMINSIAWCMRTNDITKKSDKSLSQQRLFDLVVRDASTAGRRHPNTIPICFATDVSQWSPDKCDSELFWFLVPIVSYILEKGFLAEHLTLLSLCAIMQTLERRSHHGITLMSHNIATDWLKSSIGDHLQDKKDYIKASLRDTLGRDQVITHFSSTMGKTHPLATDLQNTKFLFITEIVLHNLQINTLSNIYVTTSADDILILYVGRKGSNLPCIAKEIFKWALLFAEELAEDKTAISESGRAQYLGMEAYKLIFVLEKLTQATSSMGLANLSTSLGVAASSTVGVGIRLSLTGLSTHSAFIAQSINCTWIYWALDMFPRPGSVYESVRHLIEEDLPSAFKLPYISFVDFCSGQTLSEVELEKGCIETNIYHVYSGEMDRDFVQAAQEEDKRNVSKISAFSALKISTIRKVQPASARIIEKFLDIYSEKSPLENIDGIELGCPRANEMDSVSFRASIGPMVRSRGFYQKQKKLLMLGSYYRSRHGAIVKIGNSRKTIPEALTIYMERARKQNISANTDTCRRILNHAFPEHVAKQVIVKCRDVRYWVVSPPVRLVAIEKRPSEFTTDINELAFAVTYGMQLAYIVNPRSPFKLLRIDIDHVLSLYSRARTLGYKILSSLLSELNTTPFVAACQLRHFANIYTASISASLDNIWGGYSVEHESKTILGPTREGYTHIEPSAQDSISSFALFLCTSLPEEGTGEEYKQRLLECYYRDKPVLNWLKDGSKHGDMFKDIITHGGVSSKFSTYPVDVSLKRRWEEEVDLWIERLRSLTSTAWEGPKRPILAFKDLTLDFSFPLKITGTGSAIKEFCVVLEERTKKNLNIRDAEDGWRPNPITLLLEWGKNGYNSRLIDMKITDDNLILIKKYSPGFLTLSQGYVKLNSIRKLDEFRCSNKRINFILDSDILNIFSSKYIEDEFKLIFPGVIENVDIKYGNYISLLAGSEGVHTETQVAGSFWMPNSPSCVIQYLTSPATMLAIYNLRKIFPQLVPLSIEELQEGLCISVIAMITIAQKMWQRQPYRKKLVTTIWKLITASALVLNNKTNRPIPSIKKFIISKLKYIVSKIEREEDFNLVYSSAYDIISDLYIVEIGRGDIDKMFYWAVDKAHFLLVRDDYDDVTFVPNFGGSTYWENRDRIWWSNDLYCYKREEENRIKEEEEIMRRNEQELKEMEEKKEENENFRDTWEKTFGDWA